MAREELEFLISQCVDGTLTDHERAAAQRLIASDPEARALFSSFSAVDALARRASPVPELRWEALEHRISQAVSQQHQARLRLRWAYRAASAAAAVAAVVLLTFGWPAMQGTRTPAALDPGSAQQLAVVSGPSAQEIADQSSADVQIGRPQDASAAEMYPVAEEVVRQPSHVYIAAAVNDAALAQ